MISTRRASVAVLDQEVVRRRLRPRRGRFTSLGLGRATRTAAGDDRATASAEPRHPVLGRLPDRLLGLTPSARPEEIEEAAGELRSAWGIPGGPIANMVRLLEARGVIVSAVGEFLRVDAFSLRTDHRPVVVLSSDGGSAARRLFDAAHELAHLVLHPTPMEANEQQERQAHNFAAALLMPAGAVDPWLPRKSNQLELLEDGSAVWGVSMQALTAANANFPTWSPPCTARLTST